jgi:hypothetical protein
MARRQCRRRDAWLRKTLTREHSGLPMFGDKFPGVTLPRVGE